MSANTTGSPSLGIGLSVAALRLDDQEAVSLAWSVYSTFFPQGDFRSWRYCPSELV